MRHPHVDYRMNITARGWHIGDIHVRDIAAKGQHDDTRMYQAGHSYARKEH